MDEINVVIIDDKIDAAVVYELTQKKITSYIVEHDEVITSGGPPEHMEGKISHGSICTSIFIEFAPNCNISSIGIRDNRSGEMDGASFAAALRWCLSHNTDVIVMSIGTQAFSNFPFMLGWIDSLYEKGVVIVCACCNENCLTYPASLPKVIGVRYDILKILEHGSFLYLNNPIDGIDVISSVPDINILKKLALEYNITLSISNSIVTPYIAARICYYLISTNKHNDIRKRLKKDSVDNVPIQTYEYYKKIIQEYVELDEISVPVICFVEEDNYTNSIGLEIDALFKREDYSCAVIGGSIETNLMGNRYSALCRWLPNATGLKEIITLAYNISKPDVLLLILELEQIKHLLCYNIIDIVLSRHTSNENIIIENNDLVWISYDTVGETKQLYEKLKHILA